jgi:hypothetical protein
MGGKAHPSFTIRGKESSLWYRLQRLEREKLELATKIVMMENF